MPKACVKYAGSEFLDSANAVTTYLQGEGYTVTKTDVGEGAPISEYATPSGCDILTILAHGGWDGSMAFDEGAFGGFGQVDPGETPELWKELKTALQTAVRPGGLIVVNSCHSAGSNKWESTEGSLGDRWVHELARDMNRYTVGVEGVTAAANRHHAVKLMKFAIHGTKWLQASRAYKPGGARGPWPGPAPATPQN